MTETARPKRFYKTASVERRDGGFAIVLDGRSARIAGGPALVAPTVALANAVAGEWNAQSEFMEVSGMPLTGLLSRFCSADEEALGAMRKEMMNYLSSDLLCYRAPTPAALVERQRAIWDPYLDWLEQCFDARLAVTVGVVAAAQPASAIAALRLGIEALDARRLIVGEAATRIAGSGALALALIENVRPADEIFAASRLDEAFQNERWGEDPEAAARTAALQRDWRILADFRDLTEPEPRAPQD